MTGSAREEGSSRGPSRGPNQGSARRLAGKVAVVTGGSGGLGRGLCQALGNAGAKVAVLGRSMATTTPVAEAMQADGAEAIPVACDVLDRAALDAAVTRVHDALGPVDILVNGAGGNHPDATAGLGHSFFELDPDAVRHVFDLNFLGTFLACQAFGVDMVERGSGCIVNISSMASERPMTRVVSYAAAKAAINNFTKWLAVHMAQTYGPGIRVNAIAPGFFLTDQNRFLMLEQDAVTLTARGSAVVGHTPMGRLGDASDLGSTLLWLVDPDSTFVTGTVIAVDGGFSAFAGV